MTISIVCQHLLIVVLGAWCCDVVLSWLCNTNTKCIERTLGFNSVCLIFSWYIGQLICQFHKLIVIDEAMMTTISSCT